VAAFVKRAGRLVERATLTEAHFVPLRAPSASAELARSGVLLRFTFALDPLPERW
jgi:hypothetical protein